MYMLRKCCHSHTYIVLTCTYQLRACAAMIEWRYTSCQCSMLIDFIKEKMKVLCRTFMFGRVQVDQKK